MSVSKTRGGSWASGNYEKIALLIVLAVLLLTVATLLLVLNSRRSVISAAPWDKIPAHPAGAAGIDTNLISSLSAKLVNPVQIDLEHRRLLVGPLRVACVNKGEPIAWDATNCPFCGAIQPNVTTNFDSDGDGMPDWWEKKYGLNPFDTSDAQIDSDGDGFSNLEEYHAGTDPKDPLSHPEPHFKLRRDKISVEPFKLRFLGVSKLGSGNKYQLNLRNLERTYFATNGEIVEGVKIVGLDETDAKNPTLILQQGERTLRLVQNKVIIDESYSSVLISLIDKKPFKVTKNKSFNLGSNEYKVVDITRDTVLIRDAKNGLDTIVPLLTDGERRLLRGEDAGTPDASHRPVSGRGGDIPSGQPFDFPTR